MNEEEHPQVVLARKIATAAHEGQFRWDGVTPYITHPKAVAASVSLAYDDYTVAVAWLHDVLEDTSMTIEDLRSQGVEEDIIKSVHLLTKRKGGRYLSYILSVRNNWRARAVKMSDISHNMSCFDKPKGSLYDKYELALYILQGF